MMLEPGRVMLLADMVLSWRRPADSLQPVHCRCSRAFVLDRELYRSERGTSRPKDAKGPVIVFDDDEEEEGEEVLDEETQLMVSMGLPLTFASSSDYKKMKRNINRRPDPFEEEDEEDEEEEDEGDEPGETDEGSERDGCHGADVDEERQGDGWNPYWAQHGEALLWSSWLEKHPGGEGAEGTGCAPWDDPEMKSAWDDHAAEIYRSYWERFSYWASQGWTVEATAGDGSAGGGGAAAEAETQQEEQLSALLEGSCTLAADQETIGRSEGGSCRLEAELGGSKRPCDGGGDERRPASPPQQQAAEQTACQQNAAPSNGHRDSRKPMSLRGDDDEDEDDEDSRPRAKVKRSHEQ
ncbi:hypothetical protein OJAV_G00166740 [Oryzias javanicus]|uniref:Uncharacterized protein n=1 Tax=Oryzias javanicus TaxID=123683 RepID=A0A3S2PU61_ORYJA|nr:hypothetical protein OJAV_G00166740 [Oryzias javanicus]